MKKLGYLFLLGGFLFLLTLAGKDWRTLTANVQLNLGRWPRLFHFAPSALLTRTAALARP